MPRLAHCRARFAGLMLAVAPLAAMAQSFPVKPVRIVVAFPPAGPTDIAVRLIAPKMSEFLGQQVVIENKGGAGGNLAAAQVAKADPDGYTLLATSSAYAVNPSLWSNAGYDPLRDFVPVVQLGTQPNLICVSAAFPARTLKELLDLAKREKLSWASPGSGTTPHLTGEHLFKVLAKTDMVHVPFKGGGPAVAALVSGEPPIGSLAVSGPIAQIKSGKIRVLASSSTARHALLPDVPTLKELGYDGIEDYTWIAMFAPANTSAQVVGRLNAGANDALKNAEVRQRLEAMVVDVVGGSPESFAAYVKREVERWAKIVRATGARAD